MLTRRGGTVDERHGEHGQILVLTALLMVVMMGFAALAIDMGKQWSDRRLVQNTADFAALTAVQSIPRTFTTNVNAETSAAAMASAAENGPGTSATVQAPTVTTGCPPSARPCYTNIVVDVSVDDSNVFWPAIGGPETSTIPGSAEAAIEIDLPAMKTFPIGLTGGGGNYRCLTTGACPMQASSGDTQILAMRNTTDGCDPADADRAETTRLNFVNGVDHLVETDGSDREELPACLSGHGLTLPNYSGKIIPPGAFSVQDSITQHLIHPTRANPLWTFLPTANPCRTAVESMYDPDDETTWEVAFAHLADCLPGQPLSVAASDPRLGWAVVASSSGPGYAYQRFEPVFVHAVLDPAGTPSIESIANEVGFVYFVLQRSQISSSLTEIDPSGELTFRLVD